jgi:TetR/AcrR family transcriptional regulator, transcriptional repressor for nem operon
MSSCEAISPQFGIGIFHFLCIFSSISPPRQQLNDLIAFILSKQQDNISDDMNPVSGCPFFTAGGQIGDDEHKIRLAAQEISQKAITYNTVMIQGLLRENMLDGDVNPEQTGRFIYQYVMGLLLYGRVMYSFDIIKTDIHTGIYRLIGLKKEYWT